MKNSIKKECGESTFVLPKKVLDFRILRDLRNLDFQRWIMNNEGITMTIWENRKN